MTQESKRENPMKAEVTHLCLSIQGSLFVKKRRAT